MLLLAIDTTTRWASAALLRDGEVAGELRLYEEGGHARWIFSAVDALLRLARATPADLGALAVAVGPGSFTGVRVGVSAIQGLGLASRRPCVGVTSLEALAFKMRGSAPVLVPLMDAYREQVFAAEYDGEGNERRPPQALAPEALVELLPHGAAVLGDGARKYGDLIRSRRPDVAFPDRSLFVAAAVARLAAPRIAAGAGLAASELRPLYLRGADVRPPAAAR